MSRFLQCCKGLAESGFKDFRENAISAIGQIELSDAMSAGSLVFSELGSFLANITK